MRHLDKEMFLKHCTKFPPGPAGTAPSTSNPEESASSTTSLSLPSTSGKMSSHINSPWIAEWDMDMDDNTLDTIDEELEYMLLKDDTVDTVDKFPPGPAGTAPSTSIIEDPSAEYEPQSDPEESASSTTSLSQHSTRGSHRTMKATSSRANDSHRKPVKGSLAYLEMRKRNNESVIKSRAKSRQNQTEKMAQFQELQDETRSLKRQVAELKSQLLGKDALLNKLYGLEAVRSFIEENK